jgi:hypothetical protein
MFVFRHYGDRLVHGPRARLPSLSHVLEAYEATDDTDDDRRALLRTVQYEECLCAVGIGNAMQLCSDTSTETRFQH